MAARQDPGELLTVKAVAEKARVSEKTVRRQMDAKKLGYVTIGNAIRITTAQYLDWLRRNTTEPRL